MSKTDLISDKSNKQIGTDNNSDVDNIIKQLKIYLETISDNNETSDVITSENNNKISTTCIIHHLSNGQHEASDVCKALKFHNNEGFDFNKLIQYIGAKDEKKHLTAQNLHNFAINLAIEIYKLRNKQYYNVLVTNFRKFLSEIIDYTHHNLVYANNKTIQNTRDLYYLMSKINLHLSNNSDVKNLLILRDKLNELIKTNMQEYSKFNPSNLVSNIKSDSNPEIGELINKLNSTIQQIEKENNELISLRNEIKTGVDKLQSSVSDKVKNLFQSK